MTVRVAIAYNFNDSDWMGGRNYFASLFGAVAAVPDADVQFVLVTGRKTQTSLPEQFGALEVLRTPLMDRLHPLWLARQFTLRTLDVDPLLDRYLRSRRIDVLSHSGHLGPGSPVKALPWLYDFQFLHLPQYWNERHIRWARQRYRAACKYGDGIIVSSSDALKDLQAFAPWCSTPKSVLHFVSNPVDLDALPPKEEILERYSLPDGYFYLPNQFWASKNHRLAIDALVQLKAEGVDATIACSGKTFDGRRPGYFAELMAYRDRVGVTDRFRVLGMVPYRDLQALMANALAVINPSRFEGWSTTVEEAKTFHQRLLLSDIPVHREQSPRLGRFFAVDDVAGLASLLRECRDEGPRPRSPEIVATDYAQRLRRFGDDYLEILRRALSEGRR